MDSGARGRSLGVALAALVLAGLAPPPARAADAPARPTEEACRAACEKLVSLMDVHASIRREDGETAGHPAARPSSDACLADCRGGRLDPACVATAPALFDTVACRYYLWVDPEPAAPGAAPALAAAAPPPGAESHTALAAALRAAVLAQDDAGIRALFLPLEALRGCPSSVFGGVPPERLRELRAKVFDGLKTLVSGVDYVHEKPLVTKEELAAVEAGDYWARLGLKPRPECRLRGQVMLRLPAHRRDGATGNLAVLGVAVGDRWYHLGVAFATW